MEKPRRQAREKLRVEQPQVTDAQRADVYLAIVRSLVLAIDGMDQYTCDRILRVQRYAMATAQQMQVSAAELETVTLGALLHNIGVVGVPEYVLLNPSPLTEENLAAIHRHADIGARILKPVPFPWPVVPAVRHHHERWDGTGYPDGLAGEAIPLAARILAVADAYDAITSSRPYRKARCHREAQGILRKEAGAQFDPRVVCAFLAVVGNLVAEIAGEDEPPSQSSEGHAAPRAA